MVFGQGKPPDKLTFHLEEDPPVGQILTRFGQGLPLVKEWPRVLGIGHWAGWIDLLVQLEGVDHGSRETPGRTHFPFGREPSRGINFDKIRPGAPPSERVATGAWDWSLGRLD